ncbi:MAG TPA: H-NS family nucleoid-associated regulatory protein [Xanthobacteraceae bacterium]|nr:H-NS family nucleoid-associated regulatory protein [Xanthobacteraceae bacterium]
MAKVSNLASMSVDALLKLKEDVAEMLARKTAELKKQLQRLEGGGWGGGATGRAGRKPHPRKGKKVPIKYRDAHGNTWAGRGAQPVWLREALKAGARLEDFAVEQQPPKRGRKPGRKSAE